MLDAHDLGMLGIQKLESIAREPSNPPWRCEDFLKKKTCQIFLLGPPRSRDFPGFSGIFFTKF